MVRVKMGQTLKQYQQDITVCYMELKWKHQHKPEVRATILTKLLYHSGALTYTTAVHYILYIQYLL